MIGKLSKTMLSVYIGLWTLLVSITSLFIYFFAVGQKEWWTAIFSVKLAYVPLIVHILVISLMAGIVTFVLISFAQKIQYAQLEEKLRLLAVGNYEARVFDYSLKDITSNNYLIDIDDEISKIQQKLIELSTELQIMNSRPQLVDGETREQILEHERHRLARELHDSVSQQLFAAMMMLSALKEQADKTETPAPYRKQLALVASIINASQSEMRALLLHLRPVTLEGKTLKQGIEQLLKELQSKIQIQLKWVVEDIEMSNTIEDHLFRIVQELLSNTLRHAKAQELEVYLRRIDKNILLRVVDDGVGFDMNESKTGSYGLNNIRERTASIGGTVKIISFKDQGTSIEIKVPLTKLPTNKEG